MQAASGGLANSLGLYSDRFISSDTNSNHGEDVFCGLARTKLSRFAAGAGEKDAQATRTVCGSTETSNIIQQGLFPAQTKG